jgi:hypothetical protein
MMNKLVRPSWETGCTVLVLLVLISFKLLLEGNMGTVGLNEGDVLPLAKQFVEQDGIPNDWYLSQPPGYRLLFQTIFGNLIVGTGFLATSIMGRLLCYSLVVWGLVRLGRQLGMSSVGLVLAITWLIYADQQCFAASEWFLGGLEAKAVAYGCVMLAISLLLEGRYLWAALALGIATSFHVLVGGWTFLIALSWLLLHWQSRGLNRSQLGKILLIYGVASLWVIQPVYEQLVRPAPNSEIPPSYIYVFVRLSHHLNPLAWDSDWWKNALIFLFLLTVSAVWLHRNRDLEKNPQYCNQIGLVELTLLSLIPFALGIVVAFFDRQGAFLQYYPFRLGAVMLPLCTTLLVVCAIERSWQRWFIPRNARLAQTLFACLCLLLTSAISVGQLSHFQEQLSAVKQFPYSEEQEVTPDLKALYEWIRTNTPTDATLIAPPVDLYSLTWLTERATIASYKFFPQSKAGILEWYERIGDLSGSVSPEAVVRRDEDSRKEIRQAMTEGYHRLTREQVLNLKQKYQANYFINTVEYPVDLPIAYQNDRYILYQIP